MPTHRGIRVQLLSVLDACDIPELPTSLALPAPESDHLSPTFAQSAYVPFKPNQQFWIKYSVEPPRPDTSIYYFKLFMEDKCVVSWDCGKVHNFAGKIMFGLFDSGKTIDNIKVIHKRVLCFGELEGKIEVKVYRAKGRRRIRPQVRVFGDSQIATASDADMSLLDGGPLHSYNPQRFFKYSLLDRVDRPFAAFRYFYRTNDTLKGYGLTVPAYGNQTAASHTYSPLADHVPFPNIQSPMSDSSFGSSFASDDDGYLDDMFSDEFANDNECRPVLSAPTPPGLYQLHSNASSPALPHFPPPGSSLVSPSPLKRDRQPLRLESSGASMAVQKPELINKELPNREADKLVLHDEDNNTHQKPALPEAEKDYDKDINESLSNDGKPLVPDKDAEDRKITFKQPAKLGEGLGVGGSQGQIVKRPPTPGFEETRFGQGLLRLAVGGNTSPTCHSSQEPNQKVDAVEEQPSHASPRRIPSRSSLIAPIRNMIVRPRRSTASEASSPVPKFDDANTENGNSKKVRKVWSRSSLRSPSFSPRFFRKGSQVSLVSKESEPSPFCTRVIQPSQYLSDRSDSRCSNDSAGSGNNNNSNDSSTNKKRVKPKRFTTLEELLQPPDLPCLPFRSNDMIGTPGSSQVASSSATPNPTPTTPRARGQRPRPPPLPLNLNLDRGTTSYEVTRVQQEPSPIAAAPASEEKLQIIDPSHIHPFVHKSVEERTREPWMRIGHLGMIGRHQQEEEQEDKQPSNIVVSPRVPPSPSQNSDFCPGLAITTSEERVYISPPPHPPPSQPLPRIPLPPPLPPRAPTTPAAPNPFGAFHFDF